MTPGARIQASIEMLDSILQSWQGEKRLPADKIIDHFFKSRRFIGSKDRAFIGELVYWCLRHKASLEWWLVEKLGGDLHARGLLLTALIQRGEADIAALQTMSQDSKHAFPRLSMQEAARFGKLAHPAGDPGKARDDAPTHIRLNYPEWLDAKLRESLGEEFEAEVVALNEQAHTDLRVNTLKTTRDDLLRQLTAEGYDAYPTPVSPIGIRLAKRAPIFTSPAFKAGHFEVQDEGSQLVAALVDAKPGMKVIDFCAGAGGKTLAIAAQMQNKGRILAWDNSAKRLTQIKERLRRAGVDNVQLHVLENENDQFIKRHKDSADRVLVDAPCSGTGTWRRNPDLKWRFNQKDLDEVLAVQAAILQSSARLTKPGGLLVYATCSILKEENEQQVEKFLKNNSNFRVVPALKIWDKTPPHRSGDSYAYLRVTPHQDGVDGFFAAVLERLP
ncbi:MAG: RsmB/NOP family class I SAM-dependent RNA methyltransferase [Rickettsiales bacterium]|jgi:16S rRNA (cytosine967-C5)-methyltransferase|nr:RsmB/NOP family class I SAM-dependent RNA methyltransferase [Rickettsiales bacterium]